MKKIKIPLFPIALYLQISDEMQSMLLGQTRYCQELGRIDVELPITTSLDTIVHESVHVVQYIAKHIDTTFDDETQAYLIEFIFIEISKHLEQSKKVDVNKNK